MRRGILHGLVEIGFLVLGGHLVHELRDRISCGLLLSRFRLDPIVVAYTGERRLELTRHSAANLTIARATTEKGRTVTSGP